MSMDMTLLIWMIKLAPFLVALSYFMITSSKDFNPLFLGLVLFLILICIVIPLAIYAYNNLSIVMIFLILIGGLMVLFYYFISFVNNPMAYFSIYDVMMITSNMMMVFVIIFLLIDNMNKELLFISNSIDVLPLEMLKNVKMMDNNINYLYLYLEDKKYVLYFMLFFLLICLITIVKMIMKKKIVVNLNNIKNMLNKHYFKMKYKFF